MQIFGGALLISFKPVVVHRRQPTVENDESDPVAINSAEQTGYEFNSNNFDDEAPYSDEEPMSQTTTEDNHDSDSVTGQAGLAPGSWIVGEDRTMTCAQRRSARGERTGTD